MWWGMYRNTWSEWNSFHLIQRAPDPADWWLQWSSRETRIRTCVSWNKQQRLRCEALQGRKVRSNELGTSHMLAILPVCSEIEAFHTAFWGIKAPVAALRLGRRLGTLQWVAVVLSNWTRRDQRTQNRNPTSGKRAVPTVSPLNDMSKIDPLRPW